MTSREIRLVWRDRGSASSTLTLAAALLVALVAGCWGGGHLPDRKSADGSDDPETQARRVGSSSSRRIDEAILEANGLETLWTRQVLDGPFDRAFVAENDVFAVAYPKSRQGKFALVAYHRNNGLTHWVRPLDKRLKHKPTIYRYSPVVGEAPRAPELYIVQRDTVLCLDLDNGLTLWDAKLPYSISSGVVASETHYYVGSLDRKIYGFRKRKSFDDWFYITEGHVEQTGVISDVFVYFGCTDGRLYKFHSTKGPRYESFQLNGTMVSGDAIVGAPIQHSRWIYVGSRDYKLYCLRDNDLSEEWVHQAQAPIESSPMVADFALTAGTQSLVFCISHDTRRYKGRRTLWALTAAHGERQWKYDHVDEVVATGKRTVYITTTPSHSGGGKQLIGIDAQTGERRFSMPIDEFEMVPSSVESPTVRRGHRAIIFLVDKSGFIQALGEKF